VEDPAGQIYEGRHHSDICHASPNFQRPLDDLAELI
jgi:hypothetical protein